MASSDSPYRRCSVASLSCAPDPCRTPSPATCRSGSAGRRKSTIPAPIAEEKSESDYESAEEDTAIDALNFAQDLLDRRNASVKEQEREFAKLPLFEAGNVYSAEEAARGFRVGSTCDFEHAVDGGVRVAAGKDESAALITILPTWPGGGLAWMYWSRSTDFDLRTCAVTHGLGGWSDPSRGLRCKGVYLDSSRSFANFFILAMALDGTQIPVKGREADDATFRVYRSAVPKDVQDIVTVRELINSKHAIASGERLPAWWEL